MHFKPRLKEAGAPHTLEWPWQATWLCRENAAHCEVATAADQREVARWHSGNAMTDFHSRRLVVWEARHHNGWTTLVIGTARWALCRLGRTG
jgi:hypothetical protein